MARVFIHGKDGQSEPGAPRVMIHGPPSGIQGQQVQGQQQVDLPSVLSTSPAPQASQHREPPPMSVFEGNVLFLTEELTRTLRETRDHLSKIAKALDDISAYVKGPAPDALPENGGPKIAEETGHPKDDS